ncbi:MAG TPA: fumarylacetoacetate hydrolase, partial [Hyphomonas atlantica]|nr:fumarylacetoacetate hydrolase [Hyphomonas atlantica]
MRLVRFTGKDGDRYGILRGESIRPIPAETLEDALQTTGSEAPEIALADVELLAPVERPRKILGIGVNYAAHAAESVSFVDTKAPQVQKWFNKQATSANAPFG